MVAKRNGRSQPSTFGDPGRFMNKGRIEAFSDGVLAIIITIMVLEMKVPGNAPELSDLKPILPVFLSYLLSFLYVGIYWSNHHHLLHAIRQPSAGIMWANLHLLFWLSLIPFVTGWMGRNDFAPTPTALYGFVLLCAAMAYLILQRSVTRNEGPEARLARSIGRDTKGKFSVVLYLAGVSLAFVNQWVSGACYLIVAVLWLVPDRRVERALDDVG